MRILSKIEGDNYIEIEVQSKFLWGYVINRYRKYTTKDHRNVIYKIGKKQNLIGLGMFVTYEINDLFKTVE